MLWSVFYIWYLISAGSFTCFACVYFLLLPRSLAISLISLLVFLLNRSIFRSVALSRFFPRSLAQSIYTHCTFIAPSLPRSLAPSLPRSLAPSLPRSLAPSLPRSLTLCSMAFPLIVSLSTLILSNSDFLLF